MRPTWLLNANVPLPSVKRLRAGGWDVLSIGESDPGATDRSVMARACTEGRWLVTFDRDYGELVFRLHLASPSLILLLRVPSYRPDEPAEWIESVHAAGELQEGGFHVFDGHTIRVAHFQLPDPVGERDPIPIE